MKVLTIYAETSVFGGCFDEEFREESEKLFGEIQDGRFTLAVSSTTLRELERAPQHVRQILGNLPDEYVQRLPMSEEVERLRDAYLAFGVVGAASRLDAEHIASASVGDVDLIVSWNFRHIVHFEKIRGYHAVNLIHGYRAIAIHTPKEVIQL